MICPKGGLQMREIVYDLLPEHIRGGMKRYIEQGIIPGDFLQTVICNDLMNSFAKADDINREHMFHIVHFMYNQAPYQCYGSRTKMHKWNKKGGLNAHHK